MDLKKELINRLGVPENWDKYDYESQRYSFDDMLEVLEDIVISKQSELLFAFIKSVKEEFSDQNMDYLDFIADRVIVNNNY